MRNIKKQTTDFTLKNFSFSDQCRYFLYTKLKNYAFHAIGTRFVCLTNKRKLLKIISAKHHYGEHLRAELKNKETFGSYEHRLLHLKNLPLISEHIVQVHKVYRSGSYLCDYHDGYNIADVEARNNNNALKKEILVALNNLIAELEQYEKITGETLIGDWNLQNLLYLPKQKKILNVDLEGFFTYSSDYKAHEYKYYENHISWIKKRIKDFETNKKK